MDTAIIAGAFGLIGVIVGWWLDSSSRDHERRAVARTSLYQRLLPASQALREALILWAPSQPDAPNPLAVPDFVMAARNEYFSAEGPVLVWGSAPVQDATNAFGAAAMEYLAGKQLLHFWFANNKHSDGPRGVVNASEMVDEATPKMDEALATLRSALREDF